MKRLVFLSIILCVSYAGFAQIETPWKRAEKEIERHRPPMPKPPKSEPIVTPNRDFPRETIIQPTGTPIYADPVKISRPLGLPSEPLVEMHNVDFVKAPFSCGFYDAGYIDREKLLIKKYGFDSYVGKYPNTALAVVDRVSSLSQSILWLKKENDVAAWDIEGRIFLMRLDIERHVDKWLQSASPLKKYQLPSVSLNNRTNKEVMFTYTSGDDDYTEEKKYYTWAKIVSNVSYEVPDVVFLAHLDIKKAPIDSTYRDSVIAVHYNYNGDNIQISRQSMLSPDSAGCEGLFSMKGKTIITSKGYVPLNVDGVAGCSILETLFGQIAFSYDEIKHGNVYYVFCESKKDLRSPDFTNMIYNMFECKGKPIMIALDGDRNDAFFSTDTSNVSQIIVESAAENGYHWKAIKLNRVADIGPYSWSNIYCGKHAAHTPYEWLCVEELIDLVKITRSIVKKVANNN